MALTAAYEATYNTKEINTNADKATSHICFSTQ
jgi:hypothetical protein